MEEIFFDILRSGIGSVAPDIHKLSEKEWEEAYGLAGRHCLLGITFLGIGNHIAKLLETGLAESEIIPHGIYHRWVSNVAVIARSNELISGQGGVLQSVFRERGFNTCILKGQGVARYYGEMSSYRQCGDIDIWIWPKDRWTMSRGERMKTVLQFLRPKYKCGAPTYHNVGFMFAKGIFVEAHYTPSWMFSPLHNHRLQKWFESQARAEMLNDFSSLEFNRIYILLHIYRHLFGEGIGLKQIVDYYFVLHYRKLTGEERWQTMELLRSFGVGKFTSALMWILHHKLGLSADYLLCEPDESEGTFLLSEVLQAGNFGQYDTRIDRKRNKGKFAVFAMRIHRNFRFVTHYPSEVLWCPLWKVWHQLWLSRYNGRKV